MNACSPCFLKKFGMAFLSVWVLLACTTVFGSGASAMTNGGICYQGRVGFMIGAPEGWVNLPEAAAALGVCFMFVPVGYNLDNAPAVIYPNTGAGGGGDWVEVLSQKMLEQLSRRPGGENVQLLRGEPFVSARNLEFQQRYFNNGPAPNNFELVAYHVQDDVLLLVVLSATTEQARQDYQADFMRLLDDVFAIQMSWANETTTNNTP